MKQTFIYLSLLIGFSLFAQARFQPNLIEKVKSSVFPIVLTNDVGNKYPNSSNQRKFGFATNPMIKSTGKAEQISHQGSTGFIFEFKGENYVITSYQGQFFSDDFKIQAIVDYDLHDLEVVGADRFYDIAVLRFVDHEFSMNLTSLELSSLPLLRDQSVFTIAAPPNYVSHYVSPGEMSLLSSGAELFTKRRGYMIHYSRLIDGCSGSPIINEFGDVVGLNTQFLIKGKQPAVVALDSYTLREQFKKILQNNGEIPRSFLGIEFRQHMAGSEDGATFPMIAGVVSGGPAELPLGNKVNQYITHINGSRVNNLQQLWAKLETISPDTDVSLRLLKDARGFGVDTVTIKAAKLNSENFCKIGSYYLDAQKPDSQEEESRPKKEYIENSELEKLGKTVKLLAWGRVVSKLDLSQVTTNSLNISSENDLDSMNSLYY